MTWCHRMVICTKKNGSLRRTINFQPLNRHATRETHHCQLPFHQAYHRPYVASPISWEQLQTATTADPALQDLMFYIAEGPPSDRQALPATIRAYYPVLENMAITDDVICLGERVVIPASLCQTCLNALHAAHQGTTGMTARATSSLYWPGITTDIATTRNKCAACNSNAPSQAAMPPTTTPEQPEYPFQHICADFFHHEGAAYLVLVDRYSGWPIVSPATNGATGLAHTLRDTFATFGIPSTLTTDGGPEFTSNTTRELLCSWGVQHRLTSAYSSGQNKVPITYRLVAD